MKMTTAQRQTVRVLKEMGYRFNTMEDIGCGVILQQNTKLLTGKTIELNVATVMKSGNYELSDEIYL